MSTSTAVPATGGSGPPAAQAALLSHKQIVTIFCGLMIGMFLAALDQTIVATSIRTIADDLDGLSLQAWATTAYLITTTVTTPLYGKLSDLYGRKPLFLVAITIFVIGSVACTFATSMYELAAFRAVQGLGAGGLFSLALTIIADIVAPRERARYQGYFVAVFATSSVLGPVAGGFFAGQAEILGITGWRWVFLINVPLGILALIVVTKVLNVPLHPPRPPHRLAGRGLAERGPRPAADRRRAGADLGLGLRAFDPVLRPGRRRARGVPAVRAALSATTRCSRCGSSAPGCSAGARWRASSPGSGCSAPSRCCRCTCRSSRVRRRPRPGCRRCRWWWAS